MMDLEKQLNMELKIAEMKIKELTTIKKYDQLRGESQDIDPEEEAEELKEKRLQILATEDDLRAIRTELDSLLGELDEITPQHPRRFKGEEENVPVDDAKPAVQLGRDPTRTIAKPQKYRKGDDICTFLERFEQFVKLSKFRHAELDLFLLNLVEDDATFKKLRNITLLPEQRSNAAKLVAAVKESLFPAAEARILRSTLSTLKQRESESIEEFATRLDDTASKAYSDVAIREEATLSALISGISDVHIRQKLLESDVERLEKITRLAVKYERIAAATVKQQNSEDSELNLTDHVFAMQTPNSAFTAQQNPGFSNALTCQTCGKRHRTEDCWRDIVCSTCSRRGHPTDRCRRSPTQSRSNPLVRGDGGDRRAQITCYFCKGKGHYQEECSSRRPQGNPYQPPAPPAQSKPSSDSSKLHQRSPQASGFNPSAEQRTYLNGLATSIPSVQPDRQ